MDRTTVAGLFAALLAFFIWFGVIAPKLRGKPDQRRPSPTRAATEEAGTPEASERPGPTDGPTPSASATPTPVAQGARPHLLAKCENDKRIEWRTDGLVLTFSRHGAALVEAAFLPPAGKDAPPERVPGYSFRRVPTKHRGELRRGLMILDELFAGRRSLVVSEFKIGETERDLELESLDWELVDADKAPDEKGERSITFSAKRGAWKVTKKITARRSAPFSLEVLLRVENLGTRRRICGWRLGGPAGIVPDDKPGRYATEIQAAFAGRETQGKGLRVDFLTASKLVKTPPGDRRFSRGVNEWTGVKNRFFAAVLRPLSPNAATALFAEPLELKDDARKRLERVAPDYAAAAAPWFEGKSRERETQQQLARLAQPNALVGIERAARKNFVAPGSPIEARYLLYLGPKDEDLLARAGGDDAEFGQIIRYGYSWPFTKFDPISKLLAGVLNFFHFVGSYGLAILLLTLSVKLTLHYFTRRQMVYMHKLQQLKPELDAIKKKYEGQKSQDARQRMAREMMDFQRKHGFSPFSPMGCLVPMLVQLPMFIALYGTLRTTFGLRQAPFLWIADLSQTARLVEGFIMGYDLNLLPFLYTALALIQHSFQPKPQDDQGRMMQRTFKFMLVFFFFIFYSMPAGLVLYFVFSNVISLAEMCYIKKIVLGVPMRGVPAPVAAVGSAAPQKLEQLAQEAQAPPATSGNGGPDEGKKKRRRRRRRRRH